MQTKTISMGLLFLLALFAFAHAQAGMYKWVDENGEVVYSQHPPPSGNYEALRPSVKPMGGSTPTAQPDASDPSASASATEPERRETVDALTAQSQATRQQNCEAAKKNLAAYQIYRRFKDDQGNIVRFSEEDRQAKLQEAKRQVSDFCD